MSCVFGFEPHTCRFPVEFLAYKTFVSVVNKALNWTRLSLIESMDCFLRTAGTLGSSALLLYDHHCANGVSNETCLLTLISIAVSYETGSAPAWHAMRPRFYPWTHHIFVSIEMSCAIGSAAACHAARPGFEP